VQGGVSPAEGRGQNKAKSKIKPTGGRAPSTKVRSKKSGGQKNKTNRSKISQPSLKNQQNSAAFVI